MAHLKRLAIPRTWTLKRKKTTFVIRPTGRASLYYTLPLGVIIRNILNLAATKRELKQILSAREVKVNGVVRTDEHFPVTLMDIIEISKIGKTYRLILNTLGKLYVEEISKPKNRLCRIENKTMVGGMKLQLNLFDGSNVLADKKDYRVGDVVILTLGENKIAGKIELKEGSKVLVIRGKNVGKLARVKEIRVGAARRDLILEGEDKQFLARYDSVYVLE